MGAGAQPVPVELTPHVTIVIPTYNQRPEYLTEAIDSALYQTEPAHVVVVDDGSTEPVVDGRVEVLRHETNRGIAAALNTGIRATQTEWWCWLSSDDLAAPEKVERQRRTTIESGCKASAHFYRVFTNAPELGDVCGVYRWRDVAHQMKFLRQACCINGSTVMLHRSVFDDVGLFDESYRFGQDWEMWCRVGSKYKFHAIRQLLGYRRRGGLTETIEQDGALKAIRDAEDERIRRAYA